VVEIRGHCGAGENMVVVRGGATKGIEVPPPKKKKIIKKFLKKKELKFYP
jgi:hypothetical protein